MGSIWFHWTQQGLSESTDRRSAAAGGITNYTKCHLSNGILEGINSKVLVAKARARGYRNTQNFINMFYFIAGKLKFDYPLYIT